MYLHKGQGLQWSNTQPHRTQIWKAFEKIFRKNQNGFRRIRSTISQISTIRRILEGVRAKHLKATLLFLEFSKAFDSINKR